MLEPEAIGDIIRRYNDAIGTPNTATDGYHATITLASVRAACAHHSRYPRTAALSRVLADLLASPLGRSDWLLAYWSSERLFSTPARRLWTEPDLAALPS